MTARTMTGVLRIAALAVLVACGAAPAEAKLLGYWSFDDQGTSGGAFDDSGRGNTGTLQNTATWTANGHTGSSGDYALDLTTGPGGYVNLPTASLGTFSSTTSNNAATVSLWVYGNPSTQPKNNVNFGFYDPGGARQLQTHIPWGNATIYWDVGGGTTTGVHRISKNEPNPGNYRGAWNHYVFVKNGNTSKIYQNGGLTPWHQGTTTASIGQIVKAHIGIENGGANGYDGYIDDFAIWDEELSASDIDDLATGAASPGDWAAPLNHYANVVLADNPFAYYRFEPDNGTNGSVLTDWSGNGRHGSYQSGNTSIEADWAYGIGGTSAHFDGSNRAAGTAAQPSTAVTVEAWVKSDNANWNATGPLVSKRDAFILHPRAGTTQMQFYVHSGGWTPVTFELATIPGFDITEWHQYTGVYDQTDPGAELKLYVDGLLRAVASQTGSIDASGQPVYIGFDNNPGDVRWFDGLIDEVAIFDYALTPVQIRDHWQEAVPEPGTCALLALGGLGLVRRRRRRRR